MGVFGEVIFFCHHQSVTASSRVCRQPSLSICVLLKENHKLFDRGFRKRKMYSSLLTRWKHGWSQRKPSPPRSGILYGKIVSQGLLAAWPQQSLHTLSRSTYAVYLFWHTSIMIHRRTSHNATNENQGIGRVRCVNTKQEWGVCVGQGKTWRTLVGEPRTVSQNVPLYFGWLRSMQVWGLKPAVRRSGQSKGQVVS